jgi:UDP-N-acetylmuramate dehydrogenase
MEVRMNDIGPGISLKGLTTMHVDCSAASLYSPGSIDELREFIRNEPGNYVVIGNGSKVLFTEDWPGTVILLDKFKLIMEMPGEPDRKSGNIWVKCQAGVTISELLQYCTRKGYSGMEFLAGIPGTIGGATFVNAGAYGQSIGNVVRDLRVLDRDGCLRDVSRDAAGFQYRQSKITGIIVDVTFMLIRSDRDRVVHTIEEIISDRKRLPEGWSCGCIFKNPEGIPVGRLIEACGLKGFRIGDAEISPVHGNFIINRGDAKPEEILELMNIMKTAVRNRFHIDLTNEIRLIPG